MKDKNKGKCAGCGAELYTNNFGHANYVEGEAAPGHTIQVCAGRYGGPGNLHRAKLPCLLAARKKLAKCVGCGEVTRDFIKGPLCETCVGDIARARMMDASAESVKPYLVCSGGLFPYLDSSTQMQIARLIVRVAAGPRRHNLDDRKVFANTYVSERIGKSSSALAADPVVEMDEKQAEAMEQLAEMLYAFGKAQARDGFNQGNDLLSRLASGDITVRDYDDRIKRNK